jgi:protein-S-isoprenylcysteine O-methyltransferase Ste14
MGSLSVCEHETTPGSSVIAESWRSSDAAMRAARVDPGDRNAVIPIVTTLVVSFISAWVLAIATQVAWIALGGSYLLVALLTGLLLWAGFTAARFITHDAFEGR